MASVLDRFSSAKIKILEKHLLEKSTNQSLWLGRFVSEPSTDPKKFPYRLAEKTRLANPLSEEICYPRSQNAIKNPFGTSEKQVYVINMPSVPNIDSAIANERWIKLMGIIKAECFGKTAKESEKEVQKRVVVVIGFNRAKSLDFLDNRQFKSFVTQLPVIEGITYRAMGRLWNPLWKISCSKKGFKKIYDDPHKAFSILKSLAPKAAKAVKEFFKSNAKQIKRFRGQIPFQELRQWIATDTFAQKFFTDSLGKCPNRRIYLGIMDDDVKQMRGKGGSLLSVYDELIDKAEKYPQLMSTGYWADKKESLATQLAVALDNGTRAGSAEKISKAPYFPEPNMFLLVNSKLLRKHFSFIGGKRSDCESQHLRNHLEYYLESDRILFVARACLHTTIPDRMQASITFTKKTAASIGQKKILQALRGISQSNFHPKKWADNLQLALKSVSRTHWSQVNKHLAAIFNTFSPISLTFCLPAALGESRYNSKYFQEILDIYPTWHAAMLKCIGNTNSLNAFTKAFGKKDLLADPKQYDKFANQMAEQARKAYQELKKLKMSDEELKNVWEAAAGAGQAACDILKDWG